MKAPLRSLRAFLADLADAALGPRCPLGCGARLFDRDHVRHFRDEHAGEIDAAHIVGSDGLCRISVNGQGHFPCSQHAGDQP